MKGRSWQEAEGISCRLARAGLFCVLVSLFVLLTDGCAHQQTASHQKPVDMKSLVKKEIPDPERADQILALLEQLDADLATQRQAILASQQELKKLNADYDATPEQFMKLIDSARESRERSRQKIIDTYFRIKALTTRGEWEALAKAEMQALTDFLKKRGVSPGE